MLVSSAPPAPDWDHLLPVEGADVNYNAALLALLAAPAVAGQAPIARGPAPTVLTVVIGDRELLRAPDPHRAGVVAGATAARRLIAAGATPQHLILRRPTHDAPPDDDAAGQERYRAGIATACQGLEIPVLDEDAEPGEPSPPIAHMAGQLAEGAPPVSAAWPEGATLLLLHPPVAHPPPRGPLPPGVQRDGAHLLGASAYLAAMHGRVAGLPPAVDLEGEWRVQGLALAAIRAGLILAAQACGAGGLAVAVAQGGLAGGVGATLAARPLATAQPGYRWDVILFAERAARLVLAVRPADVGAIGRLAASQNVVAQVLGTTGGTRITCSAVLDVGLEKAAAASEDEPTR